MPTSQILKSENMITQDFCVLDVETSYSTDYNRVGNPHVPGNNLVLCGVIYSDTLSVEIDIKNGLEYDVYNTCIMWLKQRPKLNKLPKYYEHHRRFIMFTGFMEWFGVYVNKIEWFKYRFLAG